MDNEKKLELLRKAASSETMEETMVHMKELTRLQAEDMRAEGRVDEADAMLEEMSNAQEAYSSMLDIKSKLGIKGDEPTKQQRGSIKDLMNNFDKDDISVNIKLENHGNGYAVDLSGLRQISVKQMLSILLSTIYAISKINNESTDDVIKLIKMNLIANDID